MKTAIVIGGGIAGCSTAYALAKRSITVTIIERHEKLAQEASGNHIAVLYPKLSIKPSAQTALQLQGFIFTCDLLKTLNRPIYASCGVLQLAYNAREAAKQAQLLPSAHFQLLDAKAASEKAGIALHYGGLFLPQAGWVKPQTFCEVLVESPLITTMTSASALNIEKCNGHFKVIINNNQLLEADIVVICNANDVTKFSQCKSAKITPVRGQINMFAENSISQTLKTIVCSDHFIAPAVDGLHAFGTNYAANATNPNVCEKDTHENLQALRKISETLSKSAKNITGRVAWRSTTIDYIPLAGQLLDDEMLRAIPPRYNAKPAGLPWLQGLYVNAGHGSKGMITAPICGELIAAMACNEALPLDSTLASKLNPSRFLLRELGLKLLSQTLYR